MGRWKSTDFNTVAGKTSCRLRSSPRIQQADPSRFGTTRLLSITKYQKPPILDVRKLPLRDLVRVVVQEFTESSAVLVLYEAVAVFLNTAFGKVNLQPQPLFFHRLADMAVSPRLRKEEAKHPIPRRIDLHDIKTSRPRNEEEKHPVPRRINLIDIRTSRPRKEETKQAVPCGIERYDRPTLRLFSSFVDVQLFGEWTEGLLVTAGETQATVILNSPFLEEQLIEVPLADTAGFRTKTNRSSLTSSLYQIIGKYADIDVCDVFSALLRSSDRNEDSLVQLYAGVLPIGWAYWLSVNGGRRNMVLESLTFCALREFLNCVSTSQITSQAIYRIWPSLLATEDIAFPLMSVDSDFVPLLGTHFSLISRTDCPLYIVKAFKELGAYCGPPKLAWISGIEWSKVMLYDRDLYEYGKAALVYLDYCMRTVNWSEAFSVLVKILIANVQSPNPILPAEELMSLLQRNSCILETASDQQKLDVLKLVFSHPYFEGTVPLVECLFNDAVVAQQFLETAPCAACISFLNCCFSSSSPYRYMIKQILGVEFTKKMIRKTPEQQIVPLGFALRGHQALRSFRGSPAIQTFVIAQRMLCLLVLKKAGWPPMNLQREIVSYL